MLGAIPRTGWHDRFVDDLCTTVTAPSIGAAGADDDDFLSPLGQGLAHARSIPIAVIRRRSVAKPYREPGRFTGFGWFIRGRFAYPLVYGNGFPGSPGSTTNHASRDRD